MATEQITEQLLRETTRMVVLVKIPTFGYKHKVWEHRRSYYEETSYLIETSTDGTFKVLTECSRDDDWNFEIAIAQELFKSLGIRGIRIVED